MFELGFVLVVIFVYGFYHGKPHFFTIIWGKYVWVTFSIRHRSDSQIQALGKVIRNIPSKVLASQMIFC